MSEHPHRTPGRPADAAPPPPSPPEADPINTAGPGGVEAGDEDLLAALADEFAARLRRGERVTPDAYAALHPHLADRLRNVLAAIAELEGTPATATSDSAPGERRGTVIGRYKLLERIGEGGFGVVYMAEQHHPVRRRVALKVVKPGMDSRQVLARFEAERQALAIMDHPNIAKVFDGGVTDAGRPYFVMELVRGEPVTAYCDRNQLRPRQRLELFAQVCHAVQHAHQKGIIHRDIKPTNVLVALHDATPVVKVIDFGIAKALGQELTDKTLFTGFAQLVGTPLYMSPEQAGDSALDVDTRSDIYSLGVLLYELLTGSTPFDKERFRQAAQDEIRRIIREEEPPRPSTRLSESKDRLPSISAMRHTEPGKLAKLVRGELDWIVMKALEKDRARRYETANGFARDVERYLNDEPVQACPASVGYRLRKFTHRHRVPLAVAAGFLLLLVAGTVVSSYQALRIRAEQKNTVAQKAEADRQWKRAEENERSARGSERLAQQRLAEGLTSEGDALLISRQVLRARTAYDESIRIREALSLPTTPAASGLAQSYFDSPPPLTTLYSAQPHAANDCAIAPDGRTAVTGGGDGIVRLWDLVTGMPKGQLAGHRAPVRSIAFSRDGSMLITASWDGTARIWDVTAGKVLQTLTGHSRPVNSAVLTPDGLQAVTGSDDGTVCVWDARTGERQRVLEADGGSPVWSVSVSPDSRLVACAAQYAFAKVWELHSGRPVFKARHGSQVECVTFTPDGSALLATEWARTMTLWDVTTGQAVPASGPAASAATSQSSPPAPAVRTRFGLTEGSVREAVFFNDGSKLVTAGKDGTVRVWDTLSGAEVARIAARDGALGGIALSPDDRLALTPDLRVWDLARAADETVVVADGVASACSVSPDGRRAMTADGRGAVKLWDTATWKLLEAGPAHAASVTSVCFLPDGRRVVSVGWDNMLRMWDTSSDAVSERQCHMVSGGSSDPVIAASPDGRTVVFRNGNNEILVFDVDRWEVARTLRCDRPMVSVTFAADGRRLLTGHAGGYGSGCEVILWDLTSGEVVRKLKGHNHWVQSVALSADGRTAISGSWDHGVVVWDVEQGKARHVLRGHTAHVTAVALANDGSTAVSASRDGTVRLWDLRMGNQIRAFAHGKEVCGMSLLAGDASSAITVDTAGRLRVWRFDWAREVRARAERVREAQQRLHDTPGSADALREIGEWYAYRGRWDWGAELLDQAQESGARVPALTLARCAWMNGRQSEAQRWLERAAAAGEAPAEYLAMCTDAATGSSRKLAELSKAVLQHPGRPSTLTARAKWLLVHGRFDEAERDYDRLLQLHDRDPTHWYRRACLLAYLGREQQYREHCRAMLTQFASIQTPVEQNWTTKSALLRPLPTEGEGAAIDVEDLDRRADRVQQAWPQFPHPRLLKGMIEHRAGRFEQAAQSLEKFDGWAAGAIAANAFLAMARHRLGQHGEARAALERATHRAAGELPSVDDLFAANSGIEDWLIARTALREAEATVLGRPPPAPPQATGPAVPPAPPAPPDSSASSPFPGKPAAVPGVVQAEDFDLGEEGLAYYDTTVEDSGFQPVVPRYRPESVDLDACSDDGGGFNVGGVLAGEWLAYTVEVKEAGTYDLFLRLSTIGAGAKLHIEFGSEGGTVPVALPDTAGWHNWTTTTVKGVRLEAGRQQMRVVFDEPATGHGHVCNLNWIEARRSVPSPTTSPAADPQPPGK